MNTKAMACIAICSGLRGEIHVGPHIFVHCSPKLKVHFQSLGQNSKDKPEEEPRVPQGLGSGRGLGHTASSGAAIAAWSVYVIVIFLLHLGLRGNNAKNAALAGKRMDGAALR